MERSSEFRLGLLVRRSGLLSLASWIKHGSRNRLSIEIDPAGAPVVIQSIHSTPTEPSVPWLMVDVKGESNLSECVIGAYGKVMNAQPGTAIRTQVSADPILVLRRTAARSSVIVTFNGRSERVEVAPGDGLTIICPGRTPMFEPPADAEAPPKPQLTDFQQTFIAEARRRRLKTVAVHTPRWLGVSNSTKVLFDDCYPIPNTTQEAPGDMREVDIQHQADVLVASGVRRVIFSGGDEAHHRLMLALHERDPSLRFDLVFHGNFTQLQDPYVWKIFTLWAQAAKVGILHTFVTMKKGAEEVINAAGVRSIALLNYVPGDVLPPPRLNDGRKHVGIWFSGTTFKSPNPMIAAVRLIPAALMHSAGLGPHGEQLASFLGIEQGFSSSGAVPKDELDRRIRETHISLYVTPAECSPMLPLESLQLGVPCLIGPSSHLFEDNPFLHERLVVPYPDRPEVIARYAARAIDEREAIIAEWARFAPIYNDRAKALVQRFLEG